MLTYELEEFKGDEALIKVEWEEPEGYSPYYYMIGTKSPDGEASTRKGWYLSSNTIAVTTYENQKWSAKVTVWFIKYRWYFIPNTVKETLEFIIPDDEPPEPASGLRFTVNTIEA